MKYRATVLDACSGFYVLEKMTWKNFQNALVNSNIFCNHMEIRLKAQMFCNEVIVMDLQSTKNITESL